MGMAPSEFWGLAEPELQLWLNGAQQRHREWYELGLFVAWHVAAFTRVAKLPSWESLRSKFTDQPAAPKKSQTWQELKAALKFLTTRKGA